MKIFTQILSSSNSQRLQESSRLLMSDSQTAPILKHSNMKKSTPYASASVLDGLFDRLIATLSSIKEFCAPKNTRVNIIGNTRRAVFLMLLVVGSFQFVSAQYAVSKSGLDNYFSNGTNLAYWNGDRTDLTSLQAIALIDANSISVEPPIISTHDLHFSLPDLNGKALPVSYITDDIDGDEGIEIEMGLFFGWIYR